MAWLQIHGPRSSPHLHRKSCDCIRGIRLTKTRRSREASPFPHPFNYTKNPRSAVRPAPFQPPPPPMPAPPLRRDTSEELYSLPDSPFEERSTSPPRPFPVPRYGAAPVLESSLGPSSATYSARPSFLSPISTRQPAEKKEWRVFPGGFPEETLNDDLEPEPQEEPFADPIPVIEGPRRGSQPWVLIDLDFTNRSSQAAAWSPEGSPRM